MRSVLGVRPALLVCTVVAATTVSWMASCSWISSVQENLSLVTAVQAGLEEANRTQPGIRFVTRPNAWFCPDREGALSGGICPGGALLDLNELIDIVGGSPEGQLWRVMYLDDTKPGGDGFVRGDALSFRPVLNRYRVSRAAFQEEFGSELRIQDTERTEEMFLRTPEKLEGKVWLDTVRREFVYDITYASDGLSFWLPIRGAGRQGLEAFFYLRSERYVQRMARHRYACTDVYCDEFSFVAELTDHRYHPDDRPGPAEGYPVLRIVRWADRLDEYRLESKLAATPDGGTPEASRPSPERPTGVTEDGGVGYEPSP